MRAYIDAATKEGLDVGVRDLAYALLNRVFEKPVYSFKTVFANDSTKTAIATLSNGKPEFDAMIPAVLQSAFLILQPCQNI